MSESKGDVTLEESFQDMVLEAASELSEYELLLARGAFFTGVASLLEKFARASQRAKEDQQAVVDSVFAELKLVTGEMRAANQKAAKDILRRFGVR